MPSRGQSLTVSFVAWDTVNQLPKTGDGANISLRWVKDGTSAAPTNAPAEIDSTNAPGLYKVTLTATECTCDFGTLCGKSSTSGVSVMPVSVSFEQLPTVAAGTANGLPKLDGAGKVAATVASGDGVDAASIKGTIGVAGAGLTALGDTRLDHLDADVSSRLPASGYSAPLDAPGVRAAVGLGSANLDTQLLAIATKTNNLPGSPASTTDIPTVTAIAAAVRDVNNTAPAANSLGAAVNASASGGLDPQSVADLVVAGIGTVDAHVVSADAGAGLATSTELASLQAHGDTTWATATSVAVSDKTGFKLASDGLDSIATTEPTGPMSGYNFRQLLRWLVMRFNNATKTPTALTVKTSAGATATTQALADDGNGTESTGAAA